MPPEFGEYFVSIEDAPLFWLMDSPVSLFIEECLKHPEKETLKNDNDPNKLIKEYYSKWVTTARKSEKKYFAQSLFKAISKEREKYILPSIFGGVLFTFDETLKNSDTALTYYEHAEALVGEIEGDSYQKYVLSYLLKLYSGFTYYLFGRIFEANQKFKEAAVIRDDGITAKFYLGLTEIMLGNRNAGFDLVCDIYEYDLNRLTYSSTINNINLFQYFLKNPVIQNIFYYSEFGTICVQLDDYLQVKELDSKEYLAKLRAKFEIFRELHLNEYQDQNVKNNFNFIDRMLKNFYTSSLNLFYASIPILWGKLNDTLQLVLSTIRQRFLAEIQVQLKIYDVNIQDLNGLIEHLTKEIDGFKIKYKDKIKLLTANYEEHFLQQMSQLERKLTVVSEEKQNSASNAFKSSLTYTIVLSILVILVAGFASYSSNYSEELTGFSQIVKAIIVTGGKWGILTFILGFIISAISTVYAVYEKSSQKQNVIKEISHLKYIREKNIEHIRAETEKNEKITIHNLKDRIEQHRKRIAQITEEKQKRESELNEKIEIKISEEADKLLELMEKS